MARFKGKLKKAASKAVKQASKTAVKNIKAQVKAYTPLAKQLAGAALSAYTGGLVQLPQSTPKEIGEGYTGEYDRELSKIQYPGTAYNPGSQEVVTVTDDNINFDRSLQPTVGPSSVSKLFNFLGW